MIGIEQISRNAEAEERRVAGNMKLVKKHAHTIYAMFQDGASVSNLAQMYQVRAHGIEEVIRACIGGVKP